MEKAYHVGKTKKTMGAKSAWYEKLATRPSKYQLLPDGHSLCFKLLQQSLVPTFNDILRDKCVYTIMKLRVCTVHNAIADISAGAAVPLSVIALKHGLEKEFHSG